MTSTVYADSIIEFKALSSDEKKAELLKLLGKFESLDNIFVKLLGAVQTKNYVDKILEGIYEVVVKSMEKVEDLDLEAGLAHLRELYSVLEKLHLQEEADRAKEWDPDVRLNDILTTIK